MFYQQKERLRQKEANLSLPSWTTVQGGNKLEDFVLYSQVIAAYDYFSLIQIYWTQFSLKTYAQSVE